jgi:hypothetical protein
MRDYLTRRPEDFSLELVQEYYTHFTIKPRDKKIRRKYKLYLHENA